MDIIFLFLAGAVVLGFIGWFIMHNRWFIYGVAFVATVAGIIYSSSANDFFLQIFSIIVLIILIFIGFFLFSREPKVKEEMLKQEQEKLDKENVVDVEVDSADDKTDDDGEKP